MDKINFLLLVVVNKNGDIILSENHDVFLGPEGLERVPGKLGLRLEDLICFPTKEKAQDLCNMGAPFTAFCAAFNPDRGGCNASMFTGAGYVCSSEGVLEVFARSECLTQPPEPPTRISGSGQHESTSTMSRHHMSKEVKNSMKDLCSKLCPRDENGMMLSERGKGCLKRPAWVLENVMSSLREEYDPSQLERVRVYASKFMSRTALSFTRLLNLSKQDPLFATSVGTDDKRRLLSQYKEEAALWRQGPYGVLWTEEHLRRKPTCQEITACAERLMTRNNSQKANK
jgi:hypothetical protein